MDANIVIAAGFPHELLGLLRRMPGIEDLNLLQDSNRFAQTFSEKYSDKNEYIRVIDIACKLGVIAEMSSIIDEPMWRKRSFLNKSIIQLMNEKKMKEYQACEILESFMQIFGWDFEVKVARRWETTEEDTSEYHKNNNKGEYVVRKSSKEIDNSKNMDSQAEQGEKQDESVENTENNVDEKINGSTRVETKPERSNYYNNQQKNVYNKQNDNNYNEYQNLKNGAIDLKQDGRIKRETNRRISDSNYSEKTKELPIKEISVYADEENIYDRDAYIKNEILKGGIKFENLMSSAIKRDVRSAIRGNSESQYRMGKYYAEPNTKHTDYEEALKWYRVSASQGNKKAQFELGMLYDGGKVKCTDYKKQAFKCYLGLAESGFPTAQCMIGMKYKFGDGVEEDINEAIKWFKKASAQGHIDAQRNLGDTYMAIGKKEDAMKWYGRAAAAGDVYSEKMIAKR